MSGDIPLFLAVAVFGFLAGTMVGYIFGRVAQAGYERDVRRLLYGRDDSDSAGA